MDVPPCIRIAAKTDSQIPAQSGDDVAYAEGDEDAFFGVFDDGLLEGLGGFEAFVLEHGQLRRHVFDGAGGSVGHAEVGRGAVMVVPRVSGVTLFRIGHTGSFQCGSFFT